MADPITISSEVIGWIIGLFTIGVFLWRIMVYFYNKSKCFNDAIETNKYLKDQMEKLEQWRILFERDIREDINRQVGIARDTHTQLFNKLSQIESDLSFIKGRFNHRDSKDN